ncbi:MAG: glycosyltransferase, partial [Gammaproteobacteria bacterium]|nr:glycosyltransferase [Gammaproteobacteria bacterium]
MDSLQKEKQPRKQTIGVAIIARNVEGTIGQCIKSFADYVDDIVVVLAGESTDKTAKVAKAASKKVRLFNFKWIQDFAAARNFSMSKLSTDWVLWVDADDVVAGAENLRAIADAAKPDDGCVWFQYEYSFDEFGNVTTLYERERFMRSFFGWVWQGRLHETVSPIKACNYIRSHDVVIKHNHAGSEPRNERNMSILDIMYKEDPESRRVWLYLGHQHFAACLYKEALKWYLKFSSDKLAADIER